MFGWIKTAFSGIGSFFGGLPWIHIALIGTLIGSVGYGAHRVAVSFEQQSVIAQDKKDLTKERTQHAADIVTANADMVEMELQYKQDIAIVAQQKDEAIQQASDVSQQLEIIQNEKQSKIDSAASGVLANAFDWVLKQPDPYADAAGTKQPAAKRAAAGYASTCRRVLYQSDVANFLTRQFQALDECRGKLAALRKWDKN